ncbi:MAG: VWA domain-containing protein [Planctomycetes bacterium]|nr:VWA domain-containing protein [Planctomycetota bacterium]
MSAPLLAWFELDFATPQAAWLLLALPLVWWRRARGAPARVRASGGAARTAPLPSSWRTRAAWLPAALELLALLALVAALMRPVERVARPQSIEGIDIVVALDLSSSMAAEDLAAGRSRLAVAKEALDEFLARRPQDRIALLPFARWPDLRVPLTRDHAALRARLAALERVDADGPEDATGIGTALARAVQLLERSTARSKVVVLLTDGVENVATEQTPDEIAPLHAAQRAAQLGVRIDPIVVGRGERDASGAFVPLDTREVEAVAARTGGRCFLAHDAQAVAAVCSAIDALERTRFATPRWRLEERFAACLAAALLFALLARILALLGLEVAP